MMTTRNWAIGMAGLGAFLFCLAWSTQAADSAQPKGTPLRILWAGSSSLYYHNAPKVFAQWLAQQGGRPVVSDLVGRSGTGVHIYLRPEFKAEYGLKPGQTILAKIADGKYNYVVLQIPAEFINGPEGDEHDKSLDVYCRATRAADGEPVFYEMGWGRDEKAEVGRQKIFAAAVRNQVRLFVPCSTVWKRVRAERPTLELQNPPDTAHPGTLGLYLNLACFAAAFTGKPPQEIPTELRIWRALDDAQKKILSERVSKGPFDDYDAALPGWMRANLLGAKLEKVDKDIARYLGKVAWEEYEKIQKRLKGASP
jgi:hypothetical protein